MRNEVEIENTISERERERAYAKFKVFEQCRKRGVVVGYIYVYVRWNFSLQKIGRTKRAHCSLAIQLLTRIRYALRRGLARK